MSDQQPTHRGAAEDRSAAPLTETEVAASRRAPSEPPTDADLDPELDSGPASTVRRTRPGAAPTTTGDAGSGGMHMPTGGATSDNTTGGSHR
jgi:hypothetical protein